MGKQNKECETEEKHPQKIWSTGPYSAGKDLLKLQELVTTEIPWQLDADDLGSTRSTHGDGIKRLAGI
jgi:hypothetical protein